MIRVLDQNCLTRVDEVYKLVELLNKRQVHKGICEVVITLDIETYNTKADGYIYSIAMCVGGYTIILRYIEDWSRVIDIMQESTTGKIVIYVHNLGYEYFYMAQYMHKRWGIKKTIFVSGTRPIMIELYNGVIFKDSLRLFQKSLARLTHDLPHRKRVGDISHTAFHAPNIPLSPDEYGYIVCDVLGLFEAIMKLKIDHGWRVADIPLTNTGIVISTVNKMTSNDRQFKKARDSLLLDRRGVKLAYNAMGGGDTHGSRYWKGKVCRNCNMVDIKSAHPSQMARHKYPKGPISYVDGLGIKEIEALENEGFGWIAKAILFGVFVKQGNPDPTIMFSRVSNGYGIGECDNGRILDASILTLYLDMNDWRRYREGYDIEDVYFENVMFFELTELPNSFIQCVMGWFRIKESKKGGDDYAFSKICINTIFGACALKSIRDSYAIDFDTLEATKKSWKDELDELSDDEILRKQRMKLPYLWGLWTSSLTRLDIWNTICEVGWEKSLYWDTDAVYYLGEKSSNIDRLNKQIKKECEERDVVCELDGRRIYIGCLEDDYPEDQYGIEEFKFLHAKCYAYKRCGEVKAVIAGVQKEAGKTALGGDIDKLKGDLYIKNAGGVKLWYNQAELSSRMFGDRETLVGSYIYMEPRDYQVNDINTKFEIMIEG